MKIVRLTKGFSIKKKTTAKKEKEQFPLALPDKHKASNSQRASSAHVRKCNKNWRKGLKFLEISG